MCCIREHHGHITMGSRVIVEVSLVFGIGGNTVAVHRVDGNKRSNIRRVGHHAYDSDRRVCRTRIVRPHLERKHQVVDRIERGVGQRHDGILGRVGSRVEGIEPHAVAPTVRIGGRAIHCGIASIVVPRAVVDVVPAGRQVVSRHRCGGGSLFIIVVLSVGKSSKERTWCEHLGGAKQTGVAVWAKPCHLYPVAGGRF